MQEALAAPRAKATSPAAAAAEQAVEYVRSKDLRLVAGPKARAASLVAEIDSKDWVKVCEELNDARRLAIHHLALLGPILQGEGGAGDREDDEEPAQCGAQDLRDGLHRRLQRLGQPHLHRSIARIITTKEQTTRHFASYDTRTGAGVWITKVGSNINVAPEHGLQLLKFLNSIERTLAMFCCEHITEIDSV